MSPSIAQASSAVRLPAPAAGCEQYSTLLIELDEGDSADAEAAARSLGGTTDLCAHPAEVRSADGFAAFVAPSAPPTVSPMANVNGYKTFTLRDPAFAVSNSHGRYNAQVNYSNANRPVAFSFVLSSGLRAIATSSVTARQTRNPGNCSYGPKVQGAAYVFHWSCPSHTVNRRYDMNGSFVFRVNVNGSSGTATVTTAFGYVVTNVAS